MAPHLWRLQWYHCDVTPLHERSVEIRRPALHCSLHYAGPALRLTTARKLVRNHAGNTAQCTPSRFELCMYLSGAGRKLWGAVTWAHSSRCRGGGVGQFGPKRRRHELRDEHGRLKNCQRRLRSTIAKVNNHYHVFIDQIIQGNKWTSQTDQPCKQITNTHHTRLSRSHCSCCCSKAKRTRTYALRFACRQATG